jgi:hypothetical protein
MAGHPCSGDEPIPEGSKWAEIPLLEKGKNHVEGKRKNALWSGPLDFLSCGVSVFRSFFHDWHFCVSRCTLRESPICAHTFSLPILVFPTREETVYEFPPRQMPIGHQLSRGSQLPR